VVCDCAIHYVRPQAVSDLPSAHSILSRFLAEEATPDVRNLLSASIVEAAADPNIEKREFNFNVFDVEFYFKEQRVVVADVLAPNSEVQLSLADFAKALRS
jgi:hypothetical protein